MQDFIRIGDSVLYKNHHLIAFNKPNGLAVQPDQTKDPSLLQIGSTYCKTSLQLIHRLDRPVSGLVLFAKRKDAMKALHAQFREREVSKTYLAITAVAPPKDEGEAIHYLKKAKGKHSTIVLEKPEEGAQEARLNYKCIAKSDRYFLLEIALQTGRYHQIRAQLAHLGCPIKGDAKYGFRRRNPDRSVDLHAWKLSFNHPRTNIREHVIAPTPDSSLWNVFDKDLIVL